MRIEKHDAIWVVVDPTEKSELADISWKTTLAELELFIKGGTRRGEYLYDSNLTIFTDPLEAEKEAKARLEGKK
jgi:hypothetical protein